jgi:hypothetical protein
MLFSKTGKYEMRSELLPKLAYSNIITLYYGIKEKAVT